MKQEITYRTTNKAPGEIYHEHVVCSFDLGQGGDLKKIRSNLNDALSEAAVAYFENLEEEGQVTRATVTPF